MSDVVDTVKVFFQGAWNLLLQTDFPGTDISLAAISLAVLIAGFAIRIFSYLTGFHGGSDTYGKAADAADRAKAAYEHTHRRKIGF